ncbi:MAG: hypothetical protein MJ116_01685 [Lachnospiraceae bacterium]|nr:hypothetical protein [Lachnospiraceae bacterium]
MKKFAGLKIGTGEQEKVLIDEFGTPTKEGLIAAVIAFFSALGTLIIAKDILVLIISKKIRKVKKRMKKAKTAKVKLKNQALKQQLKMNRAELKQQIKENKVLLTEQERLNVELSKLPVEPSSPLWRLIKRLFLLREGA